MLGPQVAVVTSYRVEEAQAPTPVTKLRRRERVSHADTRHELDSRRDDRVSDAVLLPVYNEESTVDAVLDAVRGYFDGEVIVVDDGSTDETPRVLAARDDITVVHLDRNCGYGCALKIGFRIAHDLGVTRLITMDCDGQHEPAHIPQFLAALAEGGDIVSGSRYLPGERDGGGGAAESRQAINQRITADDQRRDRLGAHRRVLRLQGVPRCRRSTASGSTSPATRCRSSSGRRPGSAGCRVREIPVERIYCDHDRSFGAALDDPEARYAYYMDVWERALEEDVMIAEPLCDAMCIGAHPDDVEIGMGGDRRQAWCARERGSSSST